VNTDGFPRSKNQARVALAVLAGRVSTMAVVYHSKCNKRTVQRALRLMEAMGLVENRVQHTQEGRCSMWFPLSRGMWNGCVRNRCRVRLGKRKSRK
jgi:hypothetical protein